MTGSTTSGMSWPSSSSTPAMASMTSGVFNMPVLIASAPMSSRTTRICRATNSGGTGMMPKTPMVFCAVSAVIAVAA
jgi:hypothetical protein